MKKIIFISTFFITLGFTGISQEEKSNTIDAQFSELISNSNSYQNYKVIKTSDLGTIRKNIKDSINTLETSIVESKTIISDQKTIIDSSKSQIDALKIELEQTQQKVENIEFLGVPTQKTAYNTIMWSIVISLFIVSLVLFFIFKKGHSKTKEAREKLAATEIELETLRKRSLEREQKVRRELQDELNKNRL